MVSLCLSLPIYDPGSRSSQYTCSDAMWSWLQPSQHVCASPGQSSQPKQPAQPVQASPAYSGVSQPSPGHTAATATTAQPQSATTPKSTQKSIQRHPMQRPLAKLDALGLSCNIYRVRQMIAFWRALCASQKFDYFHALFEIDHLHIAPAAYPYVCLLVHGSSLFLASVRHLRHMQI